MPEMPEVQGLVEFLRGRVTGLEITRASVANIAALKTYDPPIDALHGQEITGAARHGKFIDLATEKGFGPGTKAGEIVAWLGEEHGLGRGHAMALVHVITKGAKIDAKHVNSGGAHSDASDTLWLEGKATNPRVS